MKTKYALIMMTAMVIAGNASAQTDPAMTPVLKPLNAAMATGTYAGTFLCSSGEMGMTLTLDDTGSAKTAEDIGQMPCKTGSGRCNVKQNAEINRSRTVKGVLNFFPLYSNPDAPKGVFTVSGSINYSMQKHWPISVTPQNWLQQPDNFGWSGIEGVIYDGKISGKPTARGCHTLSMTKIRTVQ